MCFHSAVVTCVESGQLKIWINGDNPVSYESAIMSVLHCKQKRMIRASDRVRKKGQNYVEIFGCIMQKNVLIMQKKKRWIMQKFEQLVKQRWPLVTNWCARFTINTMNTSILPRILALYSQNKHHFGQVLHVWSFSVICRQYFFIQHSFSIEFCEKNVHICKLPLKLSNQALDGTMENWTL